MVMGIGWKYDLTSISFRERAKDRLGHYIDINTKVGLLILFGL